MQSPPATLRFKSTRRADNKQTPPAKAPSAHSCISLRFALQARAGPLVYLCATGRSIDRKPAAPSL